MYVEERPCNGTNHSPIYSSAERSLSNGEGFITYKRKKTNLLQADAGTSSTAPHPLTDQTTKELHDTVLCHNTDKDDGIARIDHPILLEDSNDFQCGHWLNVLEHILQSRDLSENGIQSCIRDALPSIHVAPKQTAQAKEPIHCRENRQRCLWPLTRDSKKSESSWNASKKRKGISSNGSQKGPDDQTNVQTVSEKCRSVFLDVIASDKFVSLCSLLCVNFHGIKADKIFDFSLIDLRMKNGEYEQSPGLFASDIQQVWKKFKRIGNEMSRLANSLSNISQTSYRKQVGELVHESNGEQKNEEINQVGTEQRDSVDLDAATRLLSYESDCYTKPDQMEAGGLYKISTCGCCGEKANGKHSLICDGCEAMFHISCVKPSIEGIPTKTWYCVNCSANRKESPETDSTQNQLEMLHDNCEVCKRRKDLVAKKYGPKTAMKTVDARTCNALEETLDSRVGTCGVQSSRSENPRLCKLCKTEDDKEFCVCAFPQCPYKYYHKSCLRIMDRPTDKDPWYCPSCLCRACLTNKDDDKIALCDGCDEAYHIYCMVPPYTSFPKGNWYCRFCNLNYRLNARMMHTQDMFSVEKHRNNGKEVATGQVDMLKSAALKKQGMHTKGKVGLKKHRHNANGVATGSVDLLLSAALKLEEK
ncbi:PHD finger protein EHD3-like [Tasmannia lanceolata]|uniref:PHD finger protein EHD3-like n=1 Tax=Tasmannia lanceolata TaxID=3420 RepID=UPI004064AA84